MSAAIHRSHAVFHLLPGVMMNRDGFGAAESFSEELDLLDSELLDLLDREELGGVRVGDLLV